MNTRSAAPFQSFDNASAPPMRGSGILVEAGDMRRVAQVMVGIWFRMRESSRASL